MALPKEKPLVSSTDNRLLGTLCHISLCHTSQLTPRECAKRQKQPLLQLNVPVLAKMHNTALRTARSVAPVQ